jgi:hypothetical protein
MRDPLVSFNTPFQSGDGLCYPIYPQNYYKTQTSPMYGGRKKNQKTKKTQKGGNKIGDYSTPSTIENYPGTAYLSSLDQRYALTGSGVPQPMNPLTEKFLSNNMGITYATQAGGRRKNKKGGNDMDSPGAFDSKIGILGSAQGENNGTLNRAKAATKAAQAGGNDITTEEYDPINVLSDSAPKQGMYPVLSGGKYKKYSKKGGNQNPNPTGAAMSSSMPFGTLPGMPSGTLPGMPSGTLPGMPSGTLPGIPSGTLPILPGTPSISSGMMTESFMSGGRYKKYSKKGGNTGNNIFTPDATFSSQPAGIATQMNLAADLQHSPKGGIEMKDLSGVDAQMAASGPVFEEMMGGYKKSSRKLKGGVSDFATTLSSRGPINYPDALSAQRFRYFNKTGTYIPNTQLQYAAAPISTGYEADPNPYPIAYNDYIGGAAKKAAPAKKKAAPAKKKAAPAKKKAAPAKKKAAPAKKKAAPAKKK